MIALVAGAALTVATAQLGGPAGPPEALRELPVTATDMLRQPGNNSPQLAVDPTEDRFVVLANRLDGPDFGCALQVSGDGGRGWLTVDPVPELPEGADKCYAPEVAFDADGVLYYLFVGLAGRGNEPMGVFLTTSADRAQTFSAPRQVLGPHRYQVRMAIDRATGRLHLVWLEARSDPPLGGLPPAPNPIMAAHSDDAGETFSEPVQVSSPDRPRAVAPALALGPDGSVHVVYYDLRDDAVDYRGLEGPVWDGNWSLVAASSSDGGATFAEAGVIDDELVPPERVMLIFTMPHPALTVGGDGRLYAAWHDARNGDWDAFLASSADGGRTWSDLRRLNDDRLGGGSHQYLPQLDVAPDGRVDAIFYDRRNNAENRGNDVYYTYSSDRGATFAPNIRLTRLHFDSQIGARYLVPSAAGLVEFGSRIALLSENDEVLAAWTDTRNTGRAPRSQDIFATQLRFPPDDPPWPRAVGPGVAAVGLAALGLTWRRRRSTATGSAVAVLTFAAVACTGPAAAVLPPTPPTIHISMQDHRFTIAEGTIPAGRVVFSMTNDGDVDHHLALIPLPEDFPPVEEQVRSPEHRFVEQLARIPHTPPGEQAAFAVDLAPGRYAIACFVVAPDGETHAEKGMVAEFRVEAR